ncbi:hypothetical protein H0H93_004342 [Arthromyces matolae]|nr:hypothetical protein H0H93_004342 [Arthromyces matolae]
MVVLAAPEVESDAIELDSLATSADETDHQLLLRRGAQEQDNDFMADGESDHLLQKSRGHQQNSSFRILGLSFFLFGVITNVLFVIVLSAAQDLLPPSTPKGIVTFCNVTPVLFVKIWWPYILKGRIRYARRLIACCMLSFFGMIIVASFENLFMRLLGIAFAAFASGQFRTLDYEMLKPTYHTGLNELTFLQLSTTYTSPAAGAHSVMYFASGTGAAGFIGALLWWELRGLGIKVGIGLSSVLPFIIPFIYFFILPPNSAFPHPILCEDDASLASGSTLSENSSVSTMGGSIEDLGLRKRGNMLTLSDKWRIMKSSLVKYILPMFCVYLFEYTINQGVAPTLVYPVPAPEDHPILGMFIHSLKDYYPLWQLVYQIPVFFSRSSISLGFPPLPSRLLALPAIIQGFLFLILSYEAGVGIYNESSSAASIFTVFVLITIEGVCGGLAYVNAFYHINQERPDPLSAHDPDRARQEKEFKIGSIGFGDSLGILSASLLAVPTEIRLCRAQAMHALKLSEE